MGSITLPKLVAIAAVDPGRTTGVARGIFEPGTTIRDTLATGVGVESWECTGPLSEQADEIAGELDDWFSWANMESGVAIPHCHFVIEDFHLRTQRADLTPVALTAKVEDRWSHDWLPIERQQPSHAKGFASDPRLKNWGAWVVGSTHRRDAMRHVLLRLSRVLDGR